jgi:hypothetical protein
MKQARLLVPVFLAAIALFNLSTSAAYAQFVTFVSASGSNTPPCDTVATACTSLVGAYTQVRDGGIVRCAGPYHLAAGFTITKSVTIECALGGGGIDVQSLTINAPGRTVRLRNLGVNCLGTCGLPVINILAAASVSLENVQVRVASGSDPGIRDVRAGPAKLLIIDSIIEGNAGPGIVIAPSSGSIGATLDNVRSADNSYGLAVGSGGRVMVKRSVFSGNANAGIEADPGGIVGINGTLLSFNGFGLQNFGTMTVADSDIDSNSTAVTGTVQSYGNNRIFANSAEGTPLTTAGPLSSENGQR